MNEVKNVSRSMERCAWAWAGSYRDRASGGVGELSAEPQYRSGWAPDAMLHSENTDEVRCEKRRA
jgi:hypothetical protein